MAAGTRALLDTAVSFPSISEALTVLTFRGGFNTSLVLIGTTLLGIAAGSIGAFALLRKRALMGDALAHAALPGLVGAYLFAEFLGYGGKNLLVLLSGAALSGVLGVLAVQFLSRYTRLHEEAAIGAVLSSFFGLGVVLLSAVQYLDTGSAGGLSHFIYGQTAALQEHDAYTLASIAGLALIALLALRKEFTLAAFDPDFARVGGWPVTRIDLLLMTLLSTVTIVGLQAVGMIMIVALLIIPPAAARFWTERLGRMLTLSALFGGLSGYLGAAASALLPRFPAGAVIVLCAGLIFIFSFLFAPVRGVLANSFRLFRLRFRIQREHLLRDFYETVERLGRLADRSLPVSNLRSYGALSLLERLVVRLTLRIARKGCMRGSLLILSPLGWSEAQRFTRNHRLWEEYLRHHSSLLPSHLDYSADFAEHALTPEIVSRLEQRLLSQGRLRTADAVPDSLHHTAPHAREGQ